MLVSSFEIVRFAELLRSGAVVPGCHLTCQGIAGQFLRVTFQKHYTREEARSLLPEVRKWVRRLSDLVPGLAKLEERVAELSSKGDDAGGPTVNAWVRALAEVRELLFEFHRRQILLKDPLRGLVDFPAIRGNKEVFLCWEMGEEDIEYWHDLDAGYAGRERL